MTLNYSYVKHFVGFWNPNNGSTHPCWKEVPMNKKFENQQDPDGLHTKDKDN